MVHLDSIKEDASLALFMLHHLDFLEDGDRVLEDLFANTTGPNEAIQYVAFLKEIGNSLFKVSNFCKAYETYRNAMKCLCVTISAMYEECYVHTIDLEIRELVVSLQLNIAACEIKLSLFKEAIGSCTLVLGVDKSNVKALFRRGVALTKIGSMEDGYADFRIARGVEPKNKAIAQEIASLEAVLFPEEVKSKFSSVNRNVDDIMTNQDTKWVEEAPSDNSQCAEPRRP
ncbi:uncharacterized protein LOC104899109 [Beta vulgaris subsp. vulgaris]|uniref:uncharacterized protein LOC104899109 n=1 Tax=Beta vulgaris subsp. vulgaris TaxID=3555 RepID=UPI002036B2C2|nr:uncharacterized protein LOC104899109 [Beta vulgaris subsp. vulgaris]